MMRWATRISPIINMIYMHLQRVRVRAGERFLKPLPFGEDGAIPPESLAHIYERFGFFVLCMVTEIALGSPPEHAP